MLLLCITAAVPLAGLKQCSNALLPKGKLRQGAAPSRFRHRQWSWPHVLRALHWCSRRTSAQPQVTDVSADVSHASFGRAVAVDTSQKPQLPLGTANGNVGPGLPDTPGREERAGATSQRAEAMAFPPLSLPQPPVFGLHLRRSRRRVARKACHVPRAQERPACQAGPGREEVSGHEATERHEEGYSMYSMARRSTARHSMAQRSTAWHSMARHS